RHLSTLHDGHRDWRAYGGAISASSAHTASGGATRTFRVKVAPAPWLFQTTQALCRCLGAHAVAWGRSSGRQSDFLHERRLQAHWPESVDLAVNVMISIDQADILDLGPYLHDPARAL